MNFILGCIYLIVTGAVIYSMTVLFLQGVKNISNKMYLICHLCVAIWCSSQILLMLSESITALTVSYLYGNIGICFAGAFWVLFSASYTTTNGTSIKQPSKIFYLPLLLSAFHYLTIVTNNLHRLYYKNFGLDLVSHGPLFYTNVLETYLFIIVGTIILSIRVKKNKIANENSVFIKNGTILIVLAVIIPVILSIIHILGLVQLDFDITPLGFAISVILVRAATTRYQFFDMKKELDITSEKLILEKERNRIAQQVHDTTGHTLTMLQSYMKLTEIAVKDNKTEEATSYISEARSLTSKGIKELRESINQLREGENKELVTQGIMQLASLVKEIPCEVTIQGQDSEDYSYLSRIIYSSVRESITNTLKYADASKIDIVVRFKTNSIEVIIADDGKGCDAINDNNGLKGIRDRISHAGGKVKFITSSNEGFMTRISLPI